MRMIHTQTGLSLLETVFAVMLISVLIVFFFGRIVRLSVDIERENMSQTLNFLQVALRMEMFSHVMHGRLQDLPDLEASNPMTLLAQAPVNYLGEFARPDASRMPRGRWYFDTAQRVLVYRVLNETHFSGGATGVAHARFQVELKFDDANGNGTYDLNEDAQGVALIPVEPYEWLAEPTIQQNAI